MKNFIKHDLGVKVFLSDQYDKKKELEHSFFSGIMLGFLIALILVYAAPPLIKLIRSSGYVRPLPPSDLSPKHRLFKL